MERVPPRLWTGLTVGIVLASAITACGQADAPAAPTATVDLGAASEHPLTDAPHQGLVLHEQEADFHLATTYGIRYTVAVDKAHPETVRPVEGYIGMPRPTACNWYHSGFLFILLNGRDIGSTPLSSMAVAESGPRAICDLVWHDVLADVRVRFLGLPDSDHLCCEISFDPKQEIRSLAIRLNCYPSYFTAWNHRDGARRVQTPAALVEQGKSATLPAKDNWWGLYYDEVFDVAKGEGEGPCGLMLMPQEAQEITLQPGDYAVGTTLTYPPQTRRLRLAFWDFAGRTNAQALSRMRKDAGALRQELAGLDFTPACVRGFDVAGVRAELEKALQSPSARQRLGPRLAEIRAWLDKLAPVLEGRPAGSGIAAQEQMIQAVDKYYQFVWEAKLAELLDEL